jgi:hypothetical protein
MPAVRKDRAVSDECLRILLTWYTIEGDRAVSREARRAPEAAKGTLTTLVAAKRLGRRHPATTYPTIQKTKQKTNVPRRSPMHSCLFLFFSIPARHFSVHAEVNKRGRFPIRATLSYAVFRNSFFFTNFLRNIFHISIYIIII